MIHIIPQPDRMVIARSFIERHYDAPITLENISSEAGFSPYHFIRLFRAAYRKTPHQYLVQQRIEKAKELLRSSDMPINEICYTVGFESLGSFSTLFRRIAGLSPSAYRKWSTRQPADKPASIPLCHRFNRSLPDA
ncbi:MAG: AraC family transcriptional regulator [Chloroflexota bacterium]